MIALPASPTTRASATPQAPFVSSINVPYWRIHPRAGDPFVTKQTPLRALAARGLDAASVRRIELRHWRLCAIVDYDDGAFVIDGKRWDHFVQREAFAPNQQLLPLAWKRTHVALAPGGAQSHARTRYALGWRCDSVDSPNESKSLARYVVFDPAERRLWWGAE